MSALALALLTGGNAAAHEAKASPTTAAPAPAPQDAPAQAGDDATDQDIVVTGFRASLAEAINQKRNSNQIIDAITAEDISDFPDANLAEAIQRLPGVSIDRDNGEGRTITVRGLGGDFQATRLNGVDAQNVAGSNQSDTGANRSRGFDFNTFASELFGGVRITKSMAAENDEGSLGAIIDLTTGRPLSFKGNRLAIGTEGEYRENGKKWNPRLTGLASFKLTDNLGVLVSGAWQKQEQEIDVYRRAIGSFEYLYRGAEFSGVTPATYGFARPGGSGITFGSDPAAYAKLTPLTIVPALINIGRQELSYERLGATGTIQWQPTSRTEIIADVVYSKYDQDSDITGIMPIAMNRNGTNARVMQGTLRPVGTANGNADRVALYPTCAPSAIRDCDGTLTGNAILPGYLNSMNPNNLNPFDYYNNPRSPGYVPTANQTGFHEQLIGRPNIKVREANVNSANQADYLLLDDVDWRSYSDSQLGSTTFKQATLNIRHDFTDALKVELTGGWSQSKFRAVGHLTEFNSMDQDNYKFDARGEGPMPVFIPGFDIANPNNWSLVKGLSTLRLFTNMVDNEFRVARANFSYEALPEMTLRWGGTYKQFSYAGDQGRRNQGMEAVNPTLLEAGLRITDLGKTVGFGQGLDLQPGTPTSYYAPDLNKFIDAFGFNCDCVNKWGDFRAVVDGRQRAAVVERDASGFFQVDYNTELLGGPLRGNVGMRIANTRVRGDGNVGGSDGTAGTPVSATNEYWDWLPSMNANWEPSHNLLVRFAAAQVMARPQLSSLTPGTTSFSSALATTGAAPGLTVGNPYLNPFRATNLDLSFEKYFRNNGLIAATFFMKKINSFPQQVAGEAPLSSVFEPAIYQQLLGNMRAVSTTQTCDRNLALTDIYQYTCNGGSWAIRQFQDAPGGTIKGIELNLQSDFWFLPAPFDKMGVTANYTYISSSLSYLTGSALSTTTGGGASTAVNTFEDGPFLNTSPHSFNATLYYENSLWSLRASGAYRKRYVNRFPLATGTCSVGITTSGGGPCNSPVVADFGYNEDTLNVDAAFGLNITKFARFTLEGRNLTNQRQYRTMYRNNPVNQNYASTGRIVTAGMRLNF